jgi:hypothetical protein
MCGTVGPDLRTALSFALDELLMRVQARCVRVDPAFSFSATLLDVLLGTNSRRLIPARRYGDPP